MNRDTFLTVIILFFLTIASVTTIAVLPLSMFFLVYHHHKPTDYLTFVLSMVGMLMSVLLIVLQISFKPRIYEMKIFEKQRHFYERINKLCNQKRLLLYVIAFFYQEIVFVYYTRVFIAKGESIKVDSDYTGASLASI